MPPAAPTPAADDTGEFLATVLRHAGKFKGIASCVLAGVLFIIVNVWGAAMWVAKRDAERATRDRQIDARLTAIDGRLAGVWYTEDEREIQRQAERLNPGYTAPSVPAVVADRAYTSPPPDSR